MYETITANVMVKNVRETVEFYVSTLGFEKTLSVPDDSENWNFAIVAKDKISIMFQEQKNLLGEYQTLQNGEIVPTFTLFITVNDVEKLYDELKGKVKFAKELHQTFYGRNEFAIFDNNGNVLTIAE